MLSTQEKVAFLKQVSSFRSLDEEQYSTLANLCEQQAFAPGESVFRQGDEGDALFVVVRGRLAVEREIEGQQKSVSMPIVEAYSYLGEMSLFHSSPRSVTVLALSDTVTLTIDADDFRSFARQHPDLLIELNHVLSQRLLEARDKISEITLDRKPRELRKLYDKLEF